MCEVLNQVWDDFAALRAQAQVEPQVAPLIDYLCAHCGGTKSFGVWDDLPVCTECGAVDEEFVSDEPEWRGGDAESGPDKSRVGAPVNTDHFSAAWGASTVMAVSKQGSYQQKRLAMINLHTSMNHRDRALFHAYQDFDKIGKGILKLADNVMYAAKIKYKAFNEAVLTRGAVRNGIKANCIFQACREFNVARTTQEIANAFGIPARDISRTFDMYQEQLPETEIHVTTAADLIPRFFNEIIGVPDAQRGRLKMKIVRVCQELSECVELMGRTPKAVACAVMFVVLKDAGVAIDKAGLCKTCGVSVPTLGKIEAIVRSQLT